MIKGLTVEIGGDTTKLGKALESVNGKAKSLSSELGQVNRLLKLDPGNADLLAQKQEILAEAISNTSEKLKTLKAANEQAVKSSANYDAWKKKITPIQEEIDATTSSLKDMRKAADAAAEEFGADSTEYKDAAAQVVTLSDKLRDLRKQAKSVNDEFGNPVAPEQLRELQREIAATEQKLGQYERAAQETADAIEQLGSASDDVSDETRNAADGVDDFADSARDADDASGGLNDTLGKVASTGFKVVGAAVGAAITALTAAAESTRDYRVEMGKLDTAFTQNGFSSEAATGAYKELVGVLGEYDQSVEAANHLAKLTENEKDLATWTGDILPGVFATFGDSLPIEGLTEAANETAKVGQVTGPLADALNWAGVSEDAFNESLAECTSEQERQALITETLAGLYGEASAAYKETNADVIAANQANDAWTQSLAGVGAAVEPLITSVKNMGASILSGVTPAITWLLNNLPIVGTVLGGLTAALIAFKVSALGGIAAAAAPAIAAIKGLFAAMLANPIGLIIVAITALVAGFMYLWKNCEGFREFWINLWSKIKSSALAAVDGLKALPGKIEASIRDGITRVQEWGREMASRFKTAATNMLNNTINTLKNIPAKVESAISGALQNVTTWGANMVSKAKTAASNMLTNVASTLQALPGRVADAISGAITKVATWGTNMASKAKSGMSDVVSTVVSTLSSLPGKVLSVGSDLVTGLWNGINNKLAWLKSKISSFTSSVLNSIKAFFGVNSPSKETAWIGEMLDEGLSEGMLDHMSNPVKAMQRVSGGVLDAANDINGLTLGRQLQTTFSGSAAPTTGGSVLDKLDRILDAIERGQVLTIDGDQLVGATADRYDRRLGQQRALAARGAV